MSERILEFRDALREAMSQEMRRDERVLSLIHISEPTRPY